LAHDVLHILTIVFEVKIGESGEDNAGEARQKSVFSVGLRPRAWEAKVKGLKLEALSMGKGK
jgi:hypothetical protein